MTVIIEVFTHTFIPTDTLKTSYWEFPWTSILKMCTLGISLCSYLKHVFCGISLQIYLKYVHSGHFALHSILNICVMGLSLHIYDKDMFTEYFPTHQSERCLY